MDDIDIIVSGIDFLGLGLVSQERVVKDLFRNCKSSIILFTYSLTQVTDILELLKEAIVKGIHLLIIAEGSALNPKREKILTELCELNPEIVRAYIYRHRSHLFHAKVIIVDRVEAIIGSANFTFSGYNKNHEIGVHIKGVSVNKLVLMIEAFLEKCTHLQFYDY